MSPHCINLQRQAKLILELLRKGSSGKTFRDAAYKRLTMGPPKLAVLKATAHHCPCSAVPKPLGFRQYELHTSLHDPRLGRKQSIRHGMEIKL
ncbi:hypothetical protein [Ideonella paludis]|uniref:Uncharacterized protein n=1 Tax=Ideonella paludis TaxID=1233411 RepID=A0ABS5DVX9_9BURK|nr:hypothetical protein [Ideonella paludis]MBQ0935254.1 hypothetical protein [Ideonella paludis]